MPLKEGSSDKVISYNISEMLRSMTFAKGKSPAKRREMAQAAAYAKAGRSRKKKRKRKKRRRRGG